MAHTSRHSAQGLAESLESVSDQDETEMGADTLGETQRIDMQMPSVASSAGFMPPAEDDVIQPIIEPSTDRRSGFANGSRNAHAEAGAQAIAAQTVTLFGRPFDRRAVIAVAAVIAAVLAVLVGWGVVANLQSHSGDARSLVSKVEPNADGKPMQNGGTPATGKTGTGTGMGTGDAKSGNGSDANNSSDSVDFNQLTSDGTTVTDNGSDAAASNGGNAGASTDSGNGTSNGGSNNGLGSGSDANTDNSGVDAGNGNQSQPNGGEQQGTHPESDSMNFGPIV